jgi:iron only hydrogenase large subunit-like protein
MFAGSVILGDLNDYIAPSQSCINPIFTKPSSAHSVSAAVSATSRDVGFAAVDLRWDDSAAVSTATSAIAPPKPSMIKLGPENTAKITLNDCLACSGCVTSAETVLITQQSSDEVLRALHAAKSASQPTLCVVSLSPQSIASIDVHYGIHDRAKVFRKLKHVLFQLGFDLVVDTVLGNYLMLDESYREFIERLHMPRVRKWQQPPASVPVSVETSSIRETADPAVWNDSNGVVDVHHDASSGRDGRGLPLLASNCPGWVCYAEKTVPEALPYVSAVKSPQQLTGALLKMLLPKAIRRQSGTAAADEPHVYHVTIMPCYDKKLEASRRDFYWETAKSSEVDCVLSTGELLQLLTERFPDFSAIPETAAFGVHDIRCSGTSTASVAEELNVSAVERLFTGIDASGTACLTPNRTHGNSDGLAASLYARLAPLKSGGELGVASEVIEPFAVGKNSDFWEAAVKLPDQQNVITIAIAYGFRNIQGVVQKLRRGKCNYDYVEIMACPSGCVNGGGQIKIPDNRNLSGDVAVSLLYGNFTRSLY